MTWWPGWNSIEGAAKWGDIFFWAGFALLVLLAGCEILSKVYSWRKDTLIAMRDEAVVVAQDTPSKQEDQERIEARTRRDAQITAARAAAVEAETPEPEPQLQSQPQPQLQSQPALQPQSPQLPLQPQFQPQFPPQFLPQFPPQFLPQAQQPPREDEQPLARTSEQVARLQERSPRSLTDSQKKAIVALLTPFRGQKFSIVCIAGDPEGKNIAEQIVSVLRAAGWDSAEAGVGEATYNKEPVGLSLMVNSGQIMTTSVLRPVAMLVKAFADAGLMQRNGTVADPNIPRDHIEVRVGRNRNPA